MNERKKSIDELLSDLGVLEEAPVEVELKESGTPEAQGDPRAFLEEFLGGLLLLLDPGHRLEVRVEGETLKAEVKGGDLSRFIGKEGRTLRAVEHLARVVLARRFGTGYRLVLDAAGYRSRAEARIRRLAEEAALTVAMTGSPSTSPPCPPGSGGSCTCSSRTTPGSPRKAKGRERSGTWWSTPGARPKAEGPRPCRRPRGIRRSPWTCSAA